MINDPTQAPMQGLQDAAPIDPTMGGGPKPQDLMDAATALIQQAVSDYGPEIVQVFQQLLAPPPQGPPQGMPPGGPPQPGPPHPPQMGGGPPPPRQVGPPPPQR